MNAKHLTIAVVVSMCIGLGFAAAQPAAPAAGQPAATAPAPDATAPAADATAPAADAAAPAAAEAAPAVTPPVATTEVENPYGIMAILREHNAVSMCVLGLLGIMSLGTWYIFITKYLEQARALGQAKTAERKFWTASNLDEGIKNLGKNNLFRNIAERGQQAMERQGGNAGGLSQADWVQMSLTRAIEEENARLGSGVAFLASVGSTSPFVGLFGTVWGILGALTAIGVAGQMSIDKVAGPVGEALIFTALGLFVAVPAVLCYNLLVRRNKVLNEKFRSFASDLQTFLLTSKR